MALNYLFFLLIITTVDLSTNAVVVCGTLGSPQSSNVRAPPSSLWSAAWNACVTLKD